MKMKENVQEFLVVIIDELGTRGEISDRKLVIGANKKSIRYHLKNRFRELVMFQKHDKNI